MTVVFSGQNPGLTVFDESGEERIAAASYWRSVYTEHGEGNVLIIWVSPEKSGTGQHAPHAIYTDNPQVARLVTDRFTRHFGGFSDLGFENMEPQHARFAQDSDSRWYHRVMANHGDGTIELLWWDVLDYQPVNSPDRELGGTKWHLTTLICPCASAEIRINNHAVQGKPKVTQGDNGPSSSSFLAFSETWIELG